ncbi:uncharacterized protein A4U43_C08F33470 [Asparagus officinalis]|uniref:aminoacyl tRNA synthase complex-interacting multifunctional protein 1 n=1 Tax=Asparagus officinalis TaxID=4686 RepID=UPI00098E3DC1|nr:aminoacyl tRNA synthase complex-interacting multifunctional protein 1 [Asparagus officinalis]ONK61776.1 uncharacterized protein A4U43_C08F33470 [Asparagus officinalis]
MAADVETCNRNKALIFALCKCLSLDPSKFSSASVESGDLMSLFSNILKLSGSDVPLANQAEVMKWVEFASNFPCEPEACFAKLEGLNEDLASRAVLLGSGFQPSEADIVVFSALHSIVSNLSEADMQKYQNIVRWMDYIQNKVDFGGLLAKILVSQPAFEHFSSMQVDKTTVDQISKKVDKSNADTSSKKVSQASKDTNKSEGKVNSVKGAAEKKTSGNDKPAVEPRKNIKSSEEKNKQPDKESSEKDAETSITILNIQVGLIRKAWKHPSADSLIVEEIELGDGNTRQVVSGLAKYCNPEDLTNRRVALITNVKPGKLRDVMSAGLVLCASNEDHTAVEPLSPPEGAIIGEPISFAGYDGKPEDVLNPKKKQLDKITPHLYTDDKGIATYKGVPFMTSAGPCTSSIAKASIK